MGKYHKNTKHINVIWIYVEAYVSNKIPSWSSPAYLYQDQQDGMETGFALPSPVTGMKCSQQELSYATEALQTRHVFQPPSNVCAKFVIEL